MVSTFRTRRPMNRDFDPTSRYRTASFAARRRRNLRPNVDGFSVFAVLFAVAFVGTIVFGVVNSTHTSTVTCHVTDKDRTTNRDGDSDARVYTDDCGVMQVKDSILSFTWHSADTYNSITPGHTYQFKTRGYRVPLASNFPNIVGVTEISR